MKFNISDLLDDYQEDSLIAEETTPLSLQRIRQRTMDVLVPPKKHTLRHMLPRILVAAVIVSLLAVTAIANEREWQVSDWFRPALNQNAKEDAAFAEAWDLEGKWTDTFPEDRLAVINAHGKIVNQRAVGNGATITLAALYGDEYVLNLYFRVEAPEGTVLPDGLDYYFGNGVHLLDSGQPQGIVLVPQGYEISETYPLKLTAISDANPADSRKDFILSLHHSPRQQQINGTLAKPWAFHDDVPKSFAVAGLYHKTDSSGYEEILSGDFSFDITNHHAVDRRSIGLAGSDYSGRPDWGEFDYTVEPVSVALSPFSAEAEYRFTCSEQDRLVALDFRIVMKDGTTERHGQELFHKAENGYCRTVIQFTNPIDVEQIDYLLIGSGEVQHKVSP